MGRELPLHFFIIYTCGLVTDNESKLQSQKRRKVPKMRKRFKTWRWILIQVNVNPRASSAIWVWLWAAREINLGKNCGWRFPITWHLLLAKPSFSRPPCHPKLSSLPLPERRGSRLTPSRDFPPLGFSDLILPYNSNFGIIYCRRDSKNIGRASNVSLSVLPTTLWKISNQ